jgi:tetratricopeptide (TPR) repeat protein
MKSGKYDEALGKYYDICRETNRSEDYEGLPPLFNYLKQPYKAALAYIHLADRQIQEDKYDAACKSMMHALQSVPQEETLLRLRAFSHLYQGKLDRAYKTFFDLGAQLALLGKNAIADFEQALACDCTNSAVYDNIACLVEDQVQVRLFLMGFVHFCETNRAVAKEFYEKARKVQPRNPLIYLALLCRLSEDDMERIELYRILTQIFIEKSELQKAHYCFQQVFAKGQSIHSGIH